MSKTVHDLQPGDEVVISPAYGRGYQFGKVARTTKTRVVLDSGDAYMKTGVHRRVGDGEWSFNTIATVRHGELMTVEQARETNAKIAAENNAIGLARTLKATTVAAWTKALTIEEMEALLERLEVNQ